jgi:flagellar hook-basal body complex protein FliE
VIPLAPVVAPLQVASAYAGGTARPTDAPPQQFADLVGNAAESALQTMRQAEQTTAAGIAGKADVQAVVQALSNAEVTMQTVVTVRDKVLSAYNDIMHMAV